MGQQRVARLAGHGASRLRAAGGHARPRRSPKRWRGRGCASSTTRTTGAAWAPRTSPGPRSRSSCSTRATRAPACPPTRRDHGRLRAGDGGPVRAGAARAACAERREASSAEVSPQAGRIPGRRLPGAEADSGAEAGAAQPRARRPGNGCSAAIALEVLSELGFVSRLARDRRPAERCSIATAAGAEPTTRSPGRSWAGGSCSPAGRGEAWESEPGSCTDSECRPS